MSKYFAKKTGKYASKKEARRASDLQLMQSLGLISDLKEQVPFELIPRQTESGKVLERACSYIADFTYLQDGEFVVEDTKGFRTADYILKRKMLLWFKGIRIKEV